MTTEFSSKDVRDVWQKQAAEPFRMSLDEIRRRNAQLDKTIRRRNIDTFVVRFLVVACFSFSLFAFPNLIQRIGALLAVLGGGYLAYQIRVNHLQTRASASMAAKMGNAPSIDFYRAALEPERDFHSGISVWSRLVILAPGLPVLCIGEAIAHSDEAPSLCAVAVVCFAFWAVVVPLSLRRARKYQCQIYELGL
jgi:hypothetical protein